jgi:predicted flavoprotein YhiN
MSSAAVYQRSATIIGGGPAGLMVAEVLAQHGVKVDVCDGMPSIGRKFLLAGRGGLNLTHTEAREKFGMRYGDQQAQVESWLNAFAPADVREWVHALGVHTFVGSSGRVFPVEMKASPLLRKWLQRLDAAGVTFHRQHRWNGTFGEGASASVEAVQRSANRRPISAEFQTPAASGEGNG